MDQTGAINGETDRGGLVAQLKGFLADASSAPNGRLPPERELADTLGVSRAELRKALLLLERDGQLWRHVGKGTFLGPRPPQLLDVAELAQRSNPAQVMRARIALEPELARLAAVNASSSEVAELQHLNRACREARSWREYESYDARFHHEIAKTAHNPVLIALLDTLTAVRRAVTWGRPRPEGGAPSATHHSFADHERIVDAIAHREPVTAGEAMRVHLQNVEDRLVGRS